MLALTDDGQTVEYEVPGMRPNANVLAGVPSIDGYDGGVQITERWADALRRFQPDPPIDLPLRNSLTLPIEPEPLARLGVRYILLDNKRPPDVFIPGWDGPLASDDNFDVWENPAWLGDAVAWPAAIASDDPAELLRETPQVAALAAIVDDPDDAFECSGAPTECEPVGIATDRPRPEQIDLTVDARPADSRQRGAAGAARLDRRGRRQRARRSWWSTVCSSACRSRPGPHDIRFSYSSPWLTVVTGRSRCWRSPRPLRSLIGDTVVESEADFSSCGRRRPMTG